MPRERIQRLLGPARYGDTSTDVSSIPSRANIISLLLSLTTNPNIEYGDPIIIFFAGHGSRYLLSDDGDDPDFDEHEDDECPSKFVEALCPMDRDTLDSSGAIIPDITDTGAQCYPQANFLRERKPNHVHPGLLSRRQCYSNIESRSPNCSPAGACLAQGYAPHRGEALRGLPGDRSMFVEDWVADTDSHVIVAACRGNEVAKGQRVKGTEVWGGVFTNLLINTLRSGALGVGATYEDLIKALPRLSFQTPIVAGGHENTRLWYQD